MQYASQILLCCAAWISVFIPCEAKEALDPELLKTYTKDVESVLSPTLVAELQNAQSNRSAINGEQTVQRNQEPAKSINDKKPEIQIDSHVYPYHYERSYHYQYPPNPRDDPSRPIGYSEEFYEPRFRPKSHLTDSHDPTYYRSELYNPFGTSSNSQAITSHKDDNLANNRDVKQTDNSGKSEVIDKPTPLPPSSYAHPEILQSPPPPHPFPNLDVGSYRHGIFGRPLVKNYFRPNGDAGQHQKEPPGPYSPQADERFFESFHPKPIGSHQALPPLDSFENYSNKELQGFNEHRPSLPEGSAHRSHHLPPSFLGSFFPPGYQSPFHNSYRPSEHFNNLFSDNFTRNFPLRPSFGGFYPHHNYLPLPPSQPPSTPPAPVPAENKPEDIVPPGGLSSQGIPTTIPDNPAQVAAASNSQYDFKLFFPARDDVHYKSQPRSSRGSTYIDENFRF